MKTQNSFAPPFLYGTVLCKSFIHSIRSHAYSPLHNKLHMTNSGHWFMTISCIQFSDNARSIEFIQSFLYFSGSKLSTGPGRMAEFCVDIQPQTPVVTKHRMPRDHDAMMPGCLASVARRAASWASGWRLQSGPGRAGGL